MTFHEAIGENEKIDLIKLCDQNPELANDIVSNANKHSSLYRKIIDGIPTSIIIDKPPSCKQLNRMVKTTGSVIKVYPVLFKNVISEQMCIKCNQEFSLTEQELGKLKGRFHCLSCGSGSLKVSQNFQDSFPIQRIRIQDMSNHTAMSETIEVCIEGGQAGQFSPGDRISVAGFVLRKWKPLRVNEPMVSTVFIKALQVIKDCDEEDEFSEIKHLVEEYSARSVFERHEFILGSFCSELYGASHVKLGILLALIGGSAEMKDAGVSSRFNSHVLLVGDPGTGKSHLLKAISKLVTPSIFTNGVGTSDAGLTSCAVRHDKEWTLEAGALVLADMGICCIDEFNRLKVNEKSGLLEAMEQQTVSVAKAGMVTTLNSRCAVFAACGTRHDYDFDRSICDNLGISSPLISRFDLVFGLFDRSNLKSDEEICLQIFSRESNFKCPEELKWTPTVLKAYISQCRKKKNKVSKEASDILLKYYTRKKAMDGVNEFNTIRMLESLVRLAEAHSKLINEETVTKEDAFFAIILMETCIRAANTNRIDTEKVFINSLAYEKVKNQISRKFQIDP